MDGQKTQLNIEKHGGKEMLIELLMLEILNFGRSGSREKQARRNAKNQRERLGKLLFRSNLRQREINLKMLVGEAVKNVKCLKLQMGWSKLINGVQFTWNDDGVLVVSDGNKKIAEKGYHEKL